MTSIEAGTSWGASGRRVATTSIAGMTTGLGGVACEEPRVALAERARTPARRPVRRHEFFMNAKLGAIPPTGKCGRRGSGVLFGE